MRYSTLSRLLLSLLLLGSLSSIAQGQTKFQFGTPVKYDLNAPDSGAGGPQSLAVADFNKDGRLDVAVGLPGRIAVALNRGDGTLRTPVLYGFPDGAGPFGLVAADFNNDGYPDIACSTLTSGRVYVFLNRGDGTFKTPDIYPVGSGSLAAADLYREGFLDIATNLGTLRGNGSRRTVVLHHG
jgi:FG-GAP-like repeat